MWPPRSRAAVPGRSASCPALSGKMDSLVLGAIQDHLAQPGVVLLAEGGQDHSLGELRANEALAFERRPDRQVAQPGRIARRNDRLHEMEMVAMRIGQLGDGEPAGLVLGCR